MTRAQNPPSPQDDARDNARDRASAPTPAGAMEVEGKTIQELLGGRREPDPPLAPLIGNVQRRVRLDLGGTWRLLVDPLDRGERSVFGGGGIGSDHAPASPGEVVEYDFADGYELKVPGDWNTQHPELRWYRGVCWYRREFEFIPPEGGRLFLYFGGANHYARIWLNGKLVAAHRGGFTPFNVEVTDRLAAGRNVIVAKVNSLTRDEDIPTERNDWLNYGGLTREVLLVEVPGTFVRNCHIQLARSSQRRVEGWIDVDGAASGTPVSVEIPDAGLRFETETDGAGRAPVEFEAELDLWTPESPTLYRVSVQVSDAQFEEEIGFRCIETRGQEILLNGEPIFLRGIAMHEESVRHPGRAYGPEDAAAAVSLIKELNCNFVRLAHYPHNEYMVRAAERSGLIIWSEIPVYHDIAFDNPETLASAKQQLNEMIERDRNRAAIALWSIGNETMPSDTRNHFMRELAAEVRGADPTRLVTAALLATEGMRGAAAYVGARLGGNSPEPVRTVISDPLGEFVDVIGYNQYLGWYAPTFLSRGLGAPEAQVREAVLASVDEFGLETAFQKPVIVSETGGAAKHGVHGGRLDAWTEELQAAIYETEVGALIDRKGSPVRGLSPWILKDFRSPMRLNSRMQSYWNRKGIVSPEGERKQAFFVLQRRYAEHAERTGR